MSKWWPWSKPEPKPEVSAEEAEDMITGLLLQLAHETGQIVGLGMAEEGGWTLAIGERQWTRPTRAEAVMAALVDLGVT